MKTKSQLRPTVRRERLRPALNLAPKSSHEEMFTTWRQSWSEVFKGKSLMQDGIAAITVAAVALPLNIALAVACGLPPAAGLLAGAIGGGVAALFGGSVFQVTGPAAALNIMVFSLARDFGPQGVAAACIVIGVVQFILCAFSSGKLMRYVPEAVLAGFTTGVGLKLLDTQIPELLDLDYSLFALFQKLGNFGWLLEVSWFAVLPGLFVMLLVIACSSFKKFPAALVGIALATAVSVHLGWDIKRVGTIAAVFPGFHLPLVPQNQWLNLIVAAVPLAFLASIESLLSAQSVDRLSHSKPHNSNLELLGQGLANISSGLVSGMPVSGVVVRSSVNVQSGAKTRLSALLHSVILFVSILYLSETMAVIPLAALAGLLIVIGWRLVEISTLHHFLRENRMAAVAFIITAAGTLTGHLMMGLCAGTAVHFVNQWMSGGKSVVHDHKAASKPSSIRAVIERASPKRGRPNHYTMAAGGANWLTQIQQKAQLATSAFIHHKASVIGRVVLGENVHIAAESSVRADEGSPFYIGSNSNVQDGVVIHALKEKWVTVSGEDWAVYIGEDVSLAHQALIHGPCYIGDKTFVGFQAVVHDSTVGANCYIGIGAIVVGVEVPPGRYIPHGSVIDSIDKVEQLNYVTDSHMHFNEDVVEVNRGLAAAYNKHNSPKASRGQRRIPAIGTDWRTASDRF
ncbi:MAG: hypothetical protein H7249_01805 [Chitinophagaceae bacterium]|nr:hypothetical protein [Oligoflexus sp.]